jgi:Flp pilus assembly protein TadG
MLIRAQPESKRRGERGSTILEGALCLTVFLMIVFGTIDFGRMVFAYNFVSYAAREATRYAAVHGTAHAVTNDDITTFVTREAIALDSSAMTVTTSWTPDHSAGSTVQVRIQYSFTPLLPYVPSGTVRLSSTSKMLISQ